MHEHTGPTAGPTRPTKGQDATPSCVDNAAYSRPYSTKTYKQKQYKSRCALFKEQGHCSHRHIKSRCTKTCTGVGSDSSAYSRAFKTRVMQEKTFASRCAYLKELGRCLHTHTKSQCTRTCSGVGSDSSVLSRPFKTRMPVIESEKKYSSRCAYFKHRGFCSRSHLAKMCPRTCGRCTASDKTLSPRTGIHVCVQ